MLRFASVALVLVLGFLALRCGSSQDLNALVSIPAPSENPQNPAKIALGRKLFFDTRLSLDGSVSCASCHDPRKAFSDNLAKSKAVKPYNHYMFYLGLASIYFGVKWLKHNLQTEFDRRE